MKKAVSTVIIIVTIIVIFSGFTYAWLTWNSSSQTENTTVKVTINKLENTDVNYTVEYINSSNLIPVSSKELGYITLINIKQDSLSSASLTFTLKLKTLPNSLIDQSFKYAFVRIENQIETIVKEDSFYTLRQNDIITLNTPQEMEISKEYQYKLYIWIDGTVDNPNTIQNQYYNFVLNANIDNIPK